jgi:predicted nuclease with TOPRIM domain
VDLQDTYRRYITLTANQCTKEINKILARSEDDAIARKIEQIRRDSDNAGHDLELLSRSLGKTEKTAAYVESTLTKISKMEMDLDLQNSESLLKMRTAKLNRSTNHTKAMINHGIIHGKIAELDRLTSENAKLEAENDKRMETLKILQSEREEAEKRISAMMTASQHLQEHILVSVTQKPLPIFQLVEFVVADVPPITRRPSSSLGNLVVLAPIHSLSRRLQLSSERSKFFSSRLHAFPQ